MRPGLLATASGDVFRGRMVGADGVGTGEVVFNTSMTGYQEILTDPSYAGQIVVLTASHIGNYGVTRQDEQSERPAATGLVVRSLARRESNWRSEGSLADYLRTKGVVALADVDTRRLTRLVRERGAMGVAMGAGEDERALLETAAGVPTMEGRDLATTVSTAKPYVVEPEGAVRGKVVAVDLGIKRDIARRLAERGYRVEVVPSEVTAEQILAASPGGVFLSNGPGDPEPLQGPIDMVRGILGRIPVFGICLGHQVLGLALGARTFKLPFGHHGGNHPVRCLADGKVHITAQNHGFAVDLWSLAGEQPAAQSGLPGPDLLPAAVESEFGVVAASHQNLNDGTLEGLECREVDAFGVQFHPEAAPGPEDTLHLFDRFAELMGV